MKVKQNKFIIVAVSIMLIFSGSYVFAQNNNLVELSTSDQSDIFSPAELEIWKDIGDQSCLNVAVFAYSQSAGKEEMIYNGEKVIFPAEPGDSIKEFAVSGDRIGYVVRMPAEVGWSDSIILDGVNYGEVSDVVGKDVNVRLELNNDHSSYVRLTELGDARGDEPDAPHEGKFSVYLDGEIIGGMDEASVKRLNGDYVIYTQFVDGAVHVFVNGEDKGEGVLGDFDGERLAIQKENGHLIIDGVDKGSLGSGGMLGSLKDGHLVYTEGNIGNESVIYDGENMGTGHTPILEGDHLAFARTFENPLRDHLIYDGIDYGEFSHGGAGTKASLAGDHFAFAHAKNNDTLVINIDGTDHPVVLNNSSTVQITERPNCNPQAIEKLFPDVSNSSLFKKGIEKLVNDKIVQGYPDGLFRPSNYINRAEFLKIVIKALGVSPSDEYVKKCFPDIDTSQWFTKYVCYAKDHNIVGGYPDGMFRPENNINNAEALKVVLESNFDQISGESISAWHEKYFQFASGKNLLDGPLDDWANSPGSLVTRGAMAHLVAEILDPEGMAENQEEQQAGECPEGTIYYENVDDLYSFCYDQAGTVYIDEYNETVIKSVDSPEDNGGNIIKYTGYPSVDEYIESLDGEISNKQTYKNDLGTQVTIFDHGAGGYSSYTVVFMNTKGDTFSIIYPPTTPENKDFIDELVDTLLVE